MQPDDLEGAVKVSTHPKTARLGRPSAAEAARKQEQLLEVALDIFLDRGFERTTMEDIARAAQMSKRTLYSRYLDKQAIFLAAIKAASERYTVSVEALRKVETDDLKATLLAVARLRLNNLSSPEGLRLQRILSAQSYRFPELFNSLFESHTGPTLDFLVDLFTRATFDGQLAISDPRAASTAFLSLVLGGPARQLIAGSHLDSSELEARLVYAVTLFLDGTRPR